MCVYFEAPRGRSFRRPPLLYTLHRSFQGLGGEVYKVWPPTIVLQGPSEKCPCVLCLFVVFAHPAKMGPLSGPISRDIAILSLRYPISQEKKRHININKCFPVTARVGGVSRTGGQGSNVICAVRGTQGT